MVFFGHVLGQAEIADIRSKCGIEQSGLIVLKNSNLRNSWLSAEFERPAKVRLGRGSESVRRRSEAKDRFWSTRLAKSDYSACVAKNVPALPKKRTFQHNRLEVGFRCTLFELSLPAKRATAARVAESSGV